MVLFTVDVFFCHLSVMEKFPEKIAVFFNKGVLIFSKELYDVVSSLIRLSLFFIKIPVHMSSFSHATLVRSR